MRSTYPSYVFLQRWWRQIIFHGEKIKLKKKKKIYDVKIITMKWDKWDLSSTLNGTFLSCHITKIKITVHVLLLI